MTKVIFEHNPKSQTFSVGKNEAAQFVFVQDEGVTKLQPGQLPEDFEPVKLNFELTDQGAQLEVFGFVLGDGQKLIKTEILTEHKAPETSAQVNIKSVLNDQAQQEVKGIIRIPKGSKGSDSFLSHRTLMLSSQAKTKTSPQLEILEDDVKAKHAATAGKIDQDQVFYLKSRGLSEKEAQNLIVEGFWQELTQKIQDSKVRDQVCKLM